MYVQCTMQLHIAPFTITAALRWPPAHFTARDPVAIQGASELIQGRMT